LCVFALRVSSYMQQALLISESIMSEVGVPSLLARSLTLHLASHLAPCCHRSPTMGTSGRPWLLSNDREHSATAVPVSSCFRLDLYTSL
jgi:hypothetical protein